MAKATFCRCRSPEPHYPAVEVRQVDERVELIVTAPQAVCQSCGERIASDELRAIATLSRELQRTRAEVAELRRIIEGQGAGPSMNGHAPSPNGTGWLRGAKQIAAYIGASESRVKHLSACRPPRIPVRKEGKALLARKSDLDAWIEEGGGLSP